MKRIHSLVVFSILISCFVLLNANPAFAFTIEGWGYNGFGQTDVPEGNNFVDIACGEYHSLALREGRSFYLL